MKIKFNNLTVNYIPDDFSHSSKKTPLLFLHGFTGSTNDWEFLFDKLDNRFSPLAIDLPGHGKSSTPNISDYILEDVIRELISGFLSEFYISSLVICGYSMGGRAALSFAIKYPEKVKGLILESCTAGILADNDRISRIKEDDELADRLTEMGVESFLDEWYNRPLFNSLKVKTELYNKFVGAKKIDNPDGLAQSLKGFSTGRMSNHWGNLKKLNMPVLLVTGEDDKKFTVINRNMSKLMPKAEHVSVPECGHIVHLEKEEDFIILLNSFLSKI